MAIHFSYILGTAWISASSKKFQKPLTLKCLCFPIFFPYYGNSLFPCFGNFMDFLFTQNIWETHKFEMFVFSHTFPVLWKSNFPMFWELHGYLFQAKNSRNPSFKMFVFFHIFPLLWEFTFPIIWELYGFPLHPKYLRNPLLCNVCFFPYFSRIMGIHFSHVLGIVWISASPEIF